MKVLDFKQNTKPKLSKKKKVSILNIAIIVSFSLIPLLGLLILFINENNTKLIVEKDKDIVKVEISDKSKSQVESDNLSKIPKFPRDINGLAISYYISQPSENLTADSNYAFKGLKYKDDGELEFSKLEGEVMKTPIIFLESDDIDYDENKIVVEITKLIEINEFDSIELDSSLQNDTKKYYKLIKLLSAKLKDKNIRLSVNMPAKWGNEIDYSSYASLIPVIIKRIDPLEVVQYVDEIRVESYNYTTEKSILAGPITPLWWFEKVIQYYIAEGFPREKLVMTINTIGYKWIDREIEKNFKNNYILDEVQVELIKGADFSSLQKRYNTFEQVDIDEKVIKFDENFKEIIVIFPSLSLQNKLLSLSAEYSLKGVSYRI